MPPSAAPPSVYRRLLWVVGYNKLALAFVLAIPGFGVGALFDAVAASLDISDTRTRLRAQGVSVTGTVTDQKHNRKRDTYDVRIEYLANARTHTARITREQPASPGTELPLLVHPDRPWEVMTTSAEMPPDLDGRRPERSYIVGGLGTAIGIPAVALYLWNTWTTTLPHPSPRASRGARTARRKTNSRRR